MAQYLKHKRSSQLVDGSPKLPTPSQIDVGEIAINFAAGNETLSTKNSSGEVATFSSDSVLDEKYQEKISDIEEIRYNAASGFSVLNTVLYHTGNTAAHLPEVTAADNDKILQVKNGAWTLTMPSAIYNGTGQPSNQLGNNGDIFIQTT